MVSDVPSIGAEVTDLSVDAKNTVIASDLTGGGEQRHGWSTVARQRRSTLKSRQEYSRGGSDDGGGDRPDSAGVKEQRRQGSSAVGGAVQQCPGLAAVLPAVGDKGWIVERSVKGRQGEANATRQIEATPGESVVP